MEAVSKSPAVALPTLDIDAAKTMVVAGALATVAFDLFGQTVSPLLKDIVPTLGAKLAPVPLANAVVAKVTGLSGVGQLGLGHGVHVLTGLLAYPLAWAFLVQPMAARFVPKAPWWAVAAAYGVGLWAFALYVMAHLVAGNPPFLGFGGLTWVALWGHILFALVVAAVWRGRAAR